MRALHDLIFNPKRVRKSFKKNTEGHIQNGKDFARVTVECEGFPDITWNCTKEGTSYKIGNEPYTKSMGGLSLSDLLPLHPFSLFEGECFNLSRQSTRPLLFDRNGSSIFNLVDNLYEIVDVNTELQKFKNYKQNLYTEKESLEAKLESNQDIMQNMEKIKEKVSVEKLEKAFEKYQNMKIKADKLKNLKDLIIRNQNFQELVIKLDRNEIVRIIRKLENFKKLQELKSSIQKVTFIKESTKNNPVINLDKYKKLQDLRILIEDRDGYRESKRLSEQNLENLRSQLEGQVCPTCGQEYKEVSNV